MIKLLQCLGLLTWVTLLFFAGLYLDGQASYAWQGVVRGTGGLLWFCLCFYIVHSYFDEMEKMRTGSRSDKRRK